MSVLNRRDLLKLSGAGLFAGGLSPMSARLAAMIATPKSAATNERVFTIFLRGAMDAVYAVVPLGDSTHTTARGPLAVPAANTWPLFGSTYAAINQSLSALADPADPNSPDQQGKAAWIMNCGNPFGRRSHFNEQQVWETAYAPPTVADPYEEEGFVPRLATTAPFGAPLPAASVSARMQRMFRSTETTLAHVKSLARYSFGTDKIAQRVEQALGSHLGQGPTKQIEAYLEDTNAFVLASKGEIAAVEAGLTHMPDYFPTTTAEAQVAGQNRGLPPLNTPNFSGGQQFMQECEEALAMLLNSASCRYVGVEIGGWDTHVNQTATRARLDSWLAHAVRSIYDLINAPNQPPVTIMVFGEFGRTSRVNASNNGTDHGVGGAMMLFGPNVNGGVYNCHGGGGLGRQWAPLDNMLPPPYENAQPVATDFRTVLAELFDKRFGLSTLPELDAVIPGWSSLVGTSPLYNYLGVF